MTDMKPWAFELEEYAREGDTVRYASWSMIPETLVSKGIAGRIVAHMRYTMQLAKTGRFGPSLDD